PRAGSAGRQETHKRAQAAPRTRTASPLPFSPDRGACRPSNAFGDGRSVRPTPNGVQRFRREPRSARNACSRRSLRPANRTPRFVEGGLGRSTSQFTLRGVEEMETEGTLSSAWDQHLASEFDAKSAEQALATMTADPHVNLVPLMVGARGRSELRDF